MLLHTRLCLVRHGETDWNVQGRWQGSIDTPLNAKGVAQAKATALALTGSVFDALYSSDLLRAAMTAEPIGHALGLPVEHDARLRERCLGVLQGLTHDEQRIQYPEVHAFVMARTPDFQPPDGEALNAVAERVSNMLAQVAKQHAGQTVLAVAHGGVMDMCYRLAAGLPLEMKRTWPLSNASLNWLHHDGQRWCVGEWGQADHLGATRDEGTFP